ncbi:MAG: RibD family protein [Steroidobacteraceae bacterium]
MSVADSNPLAWSLLLAAARFARDGLHRDRLARFGFSQGRLQPQTDGPLEWHPASGWRLVVAAAGADLGDATALLPLCSAGPTQPLVIGQLGQSLDGFIATEKGDSCYVTGEEGLVHLHRLRALSDAVIVGAATVANDDPRLTTRRVEGHNPLRVVLDPAGRLPGSHRVWNDAAPVLRLCATLACDAAGAIRLANNVETQFLPGSQLDPSAVLSLLHERGCVTVLVEGGGRTVSAFLSAGLLDRLHLVVAPLLIGAGRAGIRLPPREPLGACLRPAVQVHALGGDTLFDCDLRVR